MPIADQDVVILAGGLGTRLRSVLPNQQKVLAPVAGEPFITRLFALLARHGARRCILALGHRAEDVLPLLEPWSQCYGMEFIPSIENSPLGTGGALRQALAHCHGTNVLALNGDSYVFADLSQLRQAHDQHQAKATLCTVRVDDVGRYGQLEWDESSGQVTAFREKSAAHAGTPGWINAGIYMLANDVIETIPEGAVTSLEKDILVNNLSLGIHAFPCTCPFIDIGLPETYEASQAFFKNLKD